MSIADSISRFADYYRRHGFVATIGRGGLAFKRILFSGRMVVFYCDLSVLVELPVNISNPRTVERITSYRELSEPDLRDMTSFWNPKLAHRNIRERFAKGASLWLIRSEGKLAGYGWTLQGETIEPYFFPLAPDDVHLFDFHVFPQYRGREMNPMLVTYILHDMALNRRGRAFIEAGEWNQAQLASLRKTPFRYLGPAWSFSLFGRTFVSWVEAQSGGAAQKGPEQNARALTAVKPPH